MRWAGLLIIFLAVVLIFLFPHYVFRFADPFQGPMKAVARPPAACAYREQRFDN
jgi:penicillin amidase